MKDLYNTPCKMYNVGAMMPYIDYTPKTLAEIIAGYTEYKYKKGQNNEN